MTPISADALMAAKRISDASGVPVKDILDEYLNAAKRGLAISKIVLDGKCYNIVLPGAELRYDMQFDVPGRFMGTKCYNIGKKICPTGAHTGSKGVCRAWANGFSYWKESSND